MLMFIKCVKWVNRLLDWGWFIILSCHPFGAKYQDDVFPTIMTTLRV